MTSLDFSIAHLVSTTNTLVQKLTLRVSTTFHFQAGQYLKIAHPSGELIPLSIATAPYRLPELDLHYQSTAAPEATLMDEMLEASKRGSCEFSICGPFGDVVSGSTRLRPLLLIAGGTGAAQAASFIDQLTATPPEHAVTALFCADTIADLYLRTWLDELDAPWLDSVFIADARRTPDNRSLAWLETRAETLMDHRIVLSGSPGFVYGAADILTRSGIAKSALESDVFTYSRTP
ncbi:MAG: hypothetical protein O7F71_08510 [Gammaproteobacteria bacterium]|nr:hypothetical protein [Gammaproteobacteria bacterium]